MAVKNIDKRVMIPKVLLFGLVILQVCVLIASMIVLKRADAGGKTNTSTFIPVWAAIFIPIIAHRSKEGKPDKTHAQFLWVLVGIALLVLVGSVIFYLKATRIV